MLRIGPTRSPGQSNPCGWFHAEETASLLDDGPLTANGIGQGFPARPTPLRALVLANAFDIIFAHRALHSAGNISPGDTTPIGWVFFIRE